MGGKTKLDDLNTRLEALEVAAETSSTKTYDRDELNDRTRASIALFFVQGFFALIAGTIIVSMIYNIIMCHGITDAEECAKMSLGVKDLLAAVTGFSGTPLGFVIGYYFKDQFDK